MKRWVIACVVLVISAFAAHRLYCNLCPRFSESRCTMEWLKTQLELSPEQFAKVTEIHERRWPEIKRLQAESATSGGESKACKAATMALIKEVCTVLTPEQCVKYERLVSPCSAGQAKGSP